MATKVKHPAIDKYELLTTKLITLMEQGKKPWVKSWHGNPCQNAITGHVYRGVNPLLCSIEMLINDWEHPYFLTFKQASEVGWQVTRGSKSVWLYWGGTGCKENKDTGEKEFYRTAKWYNLFSIHQFDDSNGKITIADWLAKKKVAQGMNPDKRIITIEEFIKAQRSQLKHMGDQPCYIPSEDTILMPEFENFTSANEYYSTLAHEHVHWTGHEKRLAREHGRFGTPKYAFEELVAELGSVFVTNALGMDYELQNHANYLNNWISVLKDDNKAFMKAASLAQKACRYLLENAGIKEEYEETEG